MLWQLADRYLQLEVDEEAHESDACYDEDVRLEIIAAYVGTAGLVLRLQCDSPTCFRRKRLNNGETAVRCIQEPFDTMVSNAAEAICMFLTSPPPEEVQRVHVNGCMAAAAP